MVNLQVDFTQTRTRNIKPLHGVNGGPRTKAFTFDTRRYYKEAGFPYARLHDVEYPYGAGEFVDIHCIFKNFDADETLPQSYNFALTNAYVAAIMETGCRPLFRLGESIEHASIKRHIYPPKDYAKWARICEHIIRHYTEGWADGFCWDIPYWEIWCEADGASGNLWQGTPEEFYELYAVTATHLKACFPHLKIGGCAFTRAIKPFIEDFFRYISTKEHRVPLDFYSWHRYFSELSYMLTDSKAARDLLNRYGYADAENVMDEWNYMENWKAQGESYRVIKSPKEAAYCAAVLCALQQQTDVDVAAYFEADVSKEWCGLFDVRNMAIGAEDHAEIVPTKAFYAFRAFNELYRMGDGVELSCDSDRIYACAAVGVDRNGVMIANYDNEATEICLTLKNLKDTRVEVRLVDEANTFVRTLTPDVPADHVTLTLPMSNQSFLYVGSAIDAE